MDRMSSHVGGTNCPVLTARFCLGVGRRLRGMATLLWLDVASDMRNYRRQVPLPPIEVLYFHPKSHFHCHLQHLHHLPNRHHHRHRWPACHRNLLARSHLLLGHSLPLNPRTLALGHLHRIRYLTIWVSF